MEDFGFGGDEFLLGDCRDDWDLDIDPDLDDPEDGADDFDDPYDAGDLDGDHTSALASIGWGTDENYGYYGEDDNW
jgi:hypothetical protein